MNWLSSNQVSKVIRRGKLKLCVTIWTKQNESDFPSFIFTFGCCFLQCYRRWANFQSILQKYFQIYKCFSFSCTQFRFWWIQRWFKIQKWNRSVSSLHKFLILKVNWRKPVNLILFKQVWIKWWNSIGPLVMVSSTNSIDSLKWWKFLPTILIDL